MIHILHAERVAKRFLEPLTDLRVDLRKHFYVLLAFCVHDL
jgi:hypothetical protein